MDEQPEKQAHNFDQQPIGTNTNHFAVSEFADAHHQENQQSTASLTLQQKIQSKVVKIKLEGLEQLKLQLSLGQECKDSNLQLWKLLKESNPACLEKAVQCGHVWLDCMEYGSLQIKELIENGYVNGKGNTKKLSIDLFFKMFESKGSDVEQTLLEIGFKSKTPKFIVGYLAILNDLLAEFGIKELKYLKPYLAGIVKILNNEKLPAIKTEGMNLLKGGLKWLGKDFMWPLISELKENIKKQLQTFWEEHDKTQTMKANRNKHQQNNLPSSSKRVDQQKGNNENVVETTDKFNVYDISDPVEIFSKFDEKWTESVLNAQKWNVKISLLQQMILKANVAKIGNSEHRHITEMIKRLLGDSNFNVVLTVLKLIGVLAKGLRKNFNYEAKQLFPLVVLKFRDKKTQMIDETLNTLTNFKYCLSLEEVGEDIKVSLKDKVAGVKIKTIIWMTSMISEKEEKFDKLIQFLKSSSFQSIFESLLNDPNPDVRDSTAKFVCQSRSLYGQGLFKNIDKNINNKDILNKFTDLAEEEQKQGQSRSQDKSNKKSRSYSKKKNIPKNDEQEEVSKRNYALKTNNDGKTVIDITDELNKHLKKLNDSSNWQNRKESAEKLITFFSDIHRQNSSSKVSSPLIHDLFGIVRSRISDPNKQLIKCYVSLAGEMFLCITQKQGKLQSRAFVQSLISSFSDKNQINKKQVFLTLDKISEAVTPQYLISTIGQVLTQEFDNTNNQSGSISKQVALQYLINNQHFLARLNQIETNDNLKEFKDFPKIILSALCDKNKDARAVAEKLFKLMSDKTGIAVFRNFVNSKQQKVAFRNDLNSFLDKFEQQPSMVSNGSFLSLTIKDNDRKRSPSITQAKQTVRNNEDRSRRKMSNVTSLCSSRSKNKDNSMIVYEQNGKNYGNTLQFISREEEDSSQVKGKSMFAQAHILTQDRVARQENGNRYRNNSDSHPINEEADVHSSLSRLVNYDELFVKMYSNDYYKTQQVIQKISKLCRDTSEANSIRETYDLFLKWIAVKLYGANLSAIELIELVCPILGVLDKKKIAWADSDIDLVLYITREFVIGCFFMGSVNMEVLRNIYQLATVLSSGERIVKKLLLEMKLAPIHKHLTSARKDGVNCSYFYKKNLAKLCGFFVDYFSCGDLLGEAAKIPQLKNDDEFCSLLSSKYHEGVLREFGFLSAERTMSYQSQNQHELKKTTQNKQHQSGQSRNVSPCAPIINNQIERSQKRTPQKISIIRNASESHFPPPSPLLKTNLINVSIPISHETCYQSKKISLQTVGSVFHNVGMEQSQRYEVDMSQYNQPSQHNPLGSNLSKLFPYNEQSIHFFTTLLQPQNQNSQKITLELSTHSNVIFAFFLNSLIKIMDCSYRDTQSPDRLIAYLSLVQQAIKCKNIMKNLSEGIIQKCMQYTIDQLVYEDENRVTVQMKLKSRGYTDFKNDTFIKGVNGVMLRILDNSMPLLLVNTILLNLVETLVLIKNNEPYPKHALPISNRNKKIGLLVRCFNRVGNSYFGQGKQKQSQMYCVDDISCLKQSHIRRFILIVKEYLEVMEITDLSSFDSSSSQVINNEESVGNVVCKILRFLNTKNLLVKNFQDLKQEKSSFSDEKVLTSFLRQLSESSANYSELLNILGNSNIQEPYSSSPPMNEDLKRVIELLSKNKTFSEGVKELKVYIQQSGGKFDFRSCFLKMNFQPSFIEKVSTELNQLKVNGTNQAVGRSLNPDIQGKLEKLKMKIDRDNANSKNGDKMDKLIAERCTDRVGYNLGSNRNNFDSKTPKNRDMVSRDMTSRDRSTEKQAPQDLKRRIQQMKNKVNMSTLGRIR